MVVCLIVRRLHLCHALTNTSLPNRNHFRAKARHLQKYACHFRATWSSLLTLASLWNNFWRNTYARLLHDLWNTFERLLRDFNTTSERLLDCWATSGKLFYDCWTAGARLSDLVWWTFGQLMDQLLDDIPVTFCLWKLHVALLWPRRKTYKFVRRFWPTKVFQYLHPPPGPPPLPPRRQHAYLTS